MSRPQPTLEGAGGGGVGVGLGWGASLLTTQWASLPLQDPGCSVKVPGFSVTDQTSLVFILKQIDKAFPHVQLALLIRITEAANY